jgi:hypothetical protein
VGTPSPGHDNRAGSVRYEDDLNGRGVRHELVDMVAASPISRGCWPDAQGALGRARAGGSFDLNRHGCLFDAFDVPERRL